MVKVALMTLDLAFRALLAALLLKVLLAALL